MGEAIDRVRPLEVAYNQSHVFVNSAQTMSSINSILYRDRDESAMDGTKTTLNHKNSCFQRLKFSNMKKSCL